MSARIGLLGGTGLGSVLETPCVVGVDTPDGRVEVASGRLPGSEAEVFFVARHGARHAHAAHRVRHAANLAALAACGVDVVFGVNNTGGLRDGLRAGDLVVPHDLVALWNAPFTSFGDETVHVDMTRPYCPHARAALVEGAAASGGSDPFHKEGIYVQVPGPRLETAAEVRILSGWGDIVGMTGGPEATVARENGLCYATLAFVANVAAGKADGPLDAGRLRDALAKGTGRIAAVLAAAADRFPLDRVCDCRDAPRRGRFGLAGTA